MPELPEVYTIAKQLNQVLAGKRIKDIKILDGKKIKIKPNQIKGLVIDKVDRVAKVIIMGFKNSNWVVMVHLKMTGQLIYQGKDNQRLAGGHPTKDWVKELPVKSTKVFFEFEDGSRLFFNDQRGFGWIKQIKQKDLDKELQNFSGVEPISNKFTVNYLKQVVKKSKAAIKNLLHDQKKIGGLGNIYINDALWLAKIHPLTPAYRLNDKKIKALYEAIKRVINEGIKAGGASDNTYVNALGLGGSYQDNFKVYKREGKTCQRHKRVKIKRIKMGSRSAFFCPKCQVKK